MQYVIWAILLIIVLIIIGLILRKRTYDKVDAFESWKIDIMNRNIASELAKIKTLNLTGETEEKFQHWKDRWEVIVTKELSEVEDYLFDAEEAADRYQFPRANKILKTIDEQLNTIEDNIENILGELNTLLVAEKESRKTIESLKPDVDQLRENLQTNRHEYGRAGNAFLQDLSNIDEQIKSYYESVEAGNYSKAEQFAEQIKDELSKFKAVLDEYPELLNLCEKEVPSTLDELLQGVREMKENGYHIPAKSYEEEIRTLKLRLRECVNDLTVEKMTETKTIISETKSRIDDIYDELEAEAHAKNYVDTSFNKYRQSVQKLNQTIKQAASDIDDLKKTYYLADHELKKFSSLQKSVEKLSEHFATLDEQISDESVPHTTMRSQLERSFEQIESLNEQLTSFTEQTHSLRKDELEAKETLEQMHEQLNEAQRQLKLSNIPGVPTFIWSMIEHALEKNEQVMVVLEKEPLDMDSVQQALDEAKRSVEQVSEQIEMTIEQAYLTERVIQYANRYRSQQPILAAKLSESERLFREFDYELALEEAAKAIEEVEPGALKRIEQIYQEQTS